MMSKFRRQGLHARRLAVAVLGLFGALLIMAGSASADSIREFELQGAQEGKSFGFYLSGVSSTKVDGGVSVAVRVGPASFPCESPAADKSATAAGGAQWEFQSIVIAEDGEPSAANFKAGGTFSGKPAGKYLACVYATDTATGTESYAIPWSHEFTVDGSSVSGNCAKAQKRVKGTSRAVKAAGKKLKGSKKQLKATKKARNGKKIAKSKKKVKTAKRKVGKAKKKLRAARKYKAAQCRT